MGTITASIFVGTAHPYHHGISPTHVLLLSENDRPGWLLHSADLAEPEAVWIPTLENMLDDGLLMAGLLAVKDPALVAAAEVFRGDYPVRVEMYEDISEEDRHRLYSLCRAIGPGTKLVVTVLEGSSLAAGLDVLHEYSFGVEVCPALYRRERSLFSNAVEVLGSLPREPLDLARSREIRSPPRGSIAAKIACLGWGSLVWNPRSLPIRGIWFHDGPLLPIEFARVCADGRVTPVLTDVECRVRSLWTLLNTKDLDAAKKALARREGIDERNIKHAIGYCETTTSSQEGYCGPDVLAWAKKQQLDAVVWTNLKAGFVGDRKIQVPPFGRIVDHLKLISDGKRLLARDYIIRAPDQVDTEYRRRLMSEFQWS